MPPLSLPSPPLPPARAPRSAAAVDPAPAVLGALVTGALGPRDVADLDVDAFACDTHRAAYPPLLAAPRLRRAAPTIAACVDACGTVALRRPGGVYVLGPGFWRPYLVQLARGAPRRPEALAAADALRRERCRREDVARDRAAMLDALAEVAEGAAWAWLRQVTEDGGMASYYARRREDGEGMAWELDVMRPLEAEAIPRPGELAAWLREAMAQRAEAERLRAAAKREDGEWREIRGLPAGHDPDSYIRAHGVEAVRAMIAGARPLHGE